MPFLSLFPPTSMAHKVKPCVHAIDCLFELEAHFAQWQSDNKPYMELYPDCVSLVSKAGLIFPFPFERVNKVVGPALSPMMDRVAMPPISCFNVWVLWVGGISETGLLNPYVLPYFKREWHAFGLQCMYT